MPRTSSHAHGVCHVESFTNASWKKSRALLYKDISLLWGWFVVSNGAKKRKKKERKKDCSRHSFWGYIVRAIPEFAAQAIVKYASLKEQRQSPARCPGSWRAQRNWAAWRFFFLPFLLKTKAAKNFPSSSCFTAYPLFAEPELTSWPYSDAVGNCENLLLGLFYFDLFKANNLAY